MIYSPSQPSSPVRGIMWRQLRQRPPTPTAGRYSGPVRDQQSCVCPPPPIPPPTLTPTPPKCLGGLHVRQPVPALRPALTICPGRAVRRSRAAAVFFLLSPTSVPVAGLVHTPFTQPDVICPPRRSVPSLINKGQSVRSDRPYSHILL